jgi:hypothetical protein
MTGRLWRAVALALLAGPASAQAQFVVLGRAATFTFGGRLHVQYENSSPESADPSGVFLRRARFIAEVDVGDWMDARVQPDFSGGEAQLQDAWIRVSLHPSLRVSMGQFHRAHEGFERTSSTELPVIERDGRVSGVRECAGVGGACSLSRLVGRLRFAGRDAGVRAEGRLGERVRYEATLTNGTGTNVGDENDAKSFSGRLSVTVAEGIELSGFYGVHDHPDSGDEDEAAYAGSGGVDVAIGSFREGFRLQASVVQGENWLLAPDATFRAASATAAWYRPLASARFAAWEPSVRVGWADPDDGGEDDQALLVTPGVMVYVAGRNRVGLNVDVYDPAGADSAWSLKVQSYLYF